MKVNADKRTQWPDEIKRSVAQYNDWYLRFAPDAYQKARNETKAVVKQALEGSEFGRSIVPQLLQEHPDFLFVLRMMTAPPLARDRLTGLSGVPKPLVDCMENDRCVPPRMAPGVLAENLRRLGGVMTTMADPELLPWIRHNRKPTPDELAGALLVLGDRVCRAVADPIIRNAQEARQLGVLESFLVARDYKQIPNGQRVTAFEMPAKTFAFRLNVPGQDESGSSVNMPMDAVVMPANRKAGPLLIEAKSAGDFTNVNKRRKEEATKIQQLKTAHGDKVRFILFLCGYFDENYLGYEAAAGIDWFWEHRPDDLSKFGI
jgi:hypothetical protein